MRFLRAESCKELFLKCIISSTILNVFVFLISFFVLDLAIYIFLESVQICLNLFLGVLIRKTNRNLLLNNNLGRKKFAKITLIGLLILFIIICEPDIIAVPYTYLILFIYEITGLDRLLTFFDYVSVLVCLSAVFLYIPRKGKLSS